MSITAITQQSRFHTETIDDGSRDVDLKGLHVLVDDTELLTDAHLRLFAGRRYGLIGRNGSGKSTLLKALGWRLVVGLPRSLRCLYVDQLEGADPEATPVELVTQADAAAVRAQAETDTLGAALEGGDPATVARALRQLELGRLEDEVRDAQQIAERRSGERGLAARQELVAAEARLAAARQRLDVPVGSEELQHATEAAQDQLNGLFDRLSLRTPEEAEAEARAILTGLLHLTPEQQDAPVSQLSGGWRMRVALAQALFLRPQVLLLDEPTNHLDLPSIIWLQKYLRGLDGVTVVVVSHDRAFLNATAEEIVVLRDRRLRYYVGNYDDYTHSVEERQAHQLRLAEGIEKKRAHMERSIQEGLKQARKKGDDKKLGMVASRKVKLQERLGVEKNAAGHRLRLNRDLVGYFENRREQADVEVQEVPPPWKVLEPAELRHKGPLAQLEAVSCGYRRSRPVLRGVTLRIDQGERLALVGPNGEGKSTLVKTITGELAPLAGTVAVHASAAVAYFQQSQVEELAAQRGSALAYMQARWPSAREQELRNHLGSFGLGGVAAQPLATLSGGQAVRVALAALFFSRPHFVILDEPSNHLDLQGVDCLVAALQQYTGGVLLVSHDQFLVEQAVGEGGRTYLVADGAMERLEGGVAEYVARLSGRKKKGKPAAAAVGRRKAAAAARAARGDAASADDA